MYSQNNLYPLSLFIRNLYEPPQNLYSVLNPDSAIMDLSRFPGMLLGWLRISTWEISGGSDEWCYGNSEFAFGKGFQIFN